MYAEAQKKIVAFNLENSMTFCQPTTESVTLHNFHIITPK